MKRSKLILMLGLAVLAQPVLLATSMSDVQAAVRKGVSEYAGQRCNTPPRGSGIVLGRYSGTTDSGGIGDGDNSGISAFRCFSTMEECQGWLYTMRSKYNDGISVLIGCSRR